MNTVTIVSLVMFCLQPLPPFTLTRTLGNVNATLISEYVIGYVIAVERKILMYKDAQDKSMWKTYVLVTNGTLIKCTRSPLCDRPRSNIE